MRHYLVPMVIAVACILLGSCGIQTGVRLTHRKEYLLALEAPVVRVRCRSEKVIDGERQILRGWASGLPCEDYIISCDHGYGIDQWYVNETSVDVLEKSKWQHELDDFVKLEKPASVLESGNCHAFRPAVWTRVWIVGYPANDSRDFSCDKRKRVAVPGIVVTGESKEDNILTVLIDISEQIGKGMSGGPVRTLVDGKMVDIGTLVTIGEAEATFEVLGPFNWPMKTKFVEVRLCD